MKHTSFLAVLFAALILPGSLIAGPAVPTFTFDEKGNGFLGATPISYTLENVTINTTQAVGHPGDINVMALAYHLGDALKNAGLSSVYPVAGEWRITDGGTFGPISDLLRWSSNGLLYVFSQPGDGKLADVGVPFTSAALFFFETTFPDGNVGKAYTSVLDPGAGYPNGDPGFIPGGMNYVYISDGTANVPEPSTLMLATFGALGLAGYRARRKMARASAAAHAA